MVAWHWSLMRARVCILVLTFCINFSVFCVALLTSSLESVTNCLESDTKTSLHFWNSPVWRWKSAFLTNSSVLLRSEIRMSTSSLASWNVASPLYAFCMMLATTGHVTCVLPVGMCSWWQCLESVLITFSLLDSGELFPLMLLTWWFSFNLISFESALLEWYFWLVL